ncbi:sigma-70 family RNA polymerase sigma factor [Azorhizobium caulinodans]|nr:sigma-70 family RNA polymerase sigma factor [Azorhizobium caulinodans]
MSEPLSARDDGVAPNASPTTDERAAHNAMILAIAERQDRAAFAALFKHFAPRLKTFLMRSGLSATAAEEIAQETMLSVWRKAGYFDPAKAGAATWIFTIARNLKIDALRRERPVAQLPTEAEDTPDEAPNGEALVLAQEREDKVRAALSRLSADQANIVRLSFFQDKPHAQIAKELGIPLGTAKSRVRLALARLRALLEDIG